MATEYGTRRTDIEGDDYWDYATREDAEEDVRLMSEFLVLIAREVSEPRIVSIRA